MLDLSIKPIINGAKYWRGPVNQLYRPTADLGQDMWEIIYSKGVLNTSKFDPILIKEWFYLLKKSGYLVIDYEAKEDQEAKEIEKNFWWLWKKKYEIIYHGTTKRSQLFTSSKTLKNFIYSTTKKPSIEVFNFKNGNSKKIRLIVKKMVSTKISGDEVTKWTFGIITNGKRIDNVEKIINSIKNQKIPNYEIIICGTYPPITYSNVRYLPFDLRDDEGWITRKKNLIIENAKYENVCIVHDRLVFNSDWYKGMKKWGNCFEILGCKQIYKNTRLIDWVLAHNIIQSKNEDDFYLTSYLDYEDWYKNSWLLGQLNILKKSIVIQNNIWYDETRYWGDKEDYYLSCNLNSHGFIHRFNIFSSVSSLSFNYLKPSYIKFDGKSAIPRLKFTNFYPLLKITNYYLSVILKKLPLGIKVNNIENLRAKLYKIIFN